MTGRPDRTRKRNVPRRCHGNGKARFLTWRPVECPVTAFPDLSPGLAWGELRGDLSKKLRLTRAVSPTLFRAWMPGADPEPRGHPKQAELRTDKRPFRKRSFQSRARWTGKRSDPPG
ncbi:hypothetical protein SKAU_G00085430 [Synaphobranchus kaupii]|uniref:Uncharacterized protein n=1 Tax=Synaphobranchus kaupii TaxID=118154 RepID=A0A9Q1FWI4_SYNKA|nr:hypothetical protein SKAU_G00085430 [Synaphobranchus kaupii]